MAFNWKTFRTRSGTAVIFVLVMMAGLLWNHWSFFLLFSVIHFGCWYEYQKLTAGFEPDYAGITPFHRFGVMLAGYALMLFLSGDQLALGGLSLHSLGWWMGLLFFFFLPIIELLFARRIQPKNIKASFLGILYISLSWGLLLDLRCIDAVWTRANGSPFELGKVLPLAIIFSIWINDTMAYIVGSLIGKTPLSVISPKKTWEGTIGGIILSVVVMGLIARGFGFPIVDACIIAAIAAITGTIGDLLESKLKRMAGVKDSGSFMPGHGGFLDRFDSLLFATPFVWIYVRAFMEGW
ncbi:phosphatidate cytidylyltransferase [Flavihumibacter rivuli]|uniref:phosphatidate cytidylyltransferase n=1 Tax=Flavihumibacter rivuli TaxID=2838156 RepID=UPI001BDE9C6C|nr:phosphatidate cytidylyltransferase [Flavihumibacter rivuli]ULQ56119.1 phosphatidate cytidylyltransferase [Flavihumibacter rivuli]